MWRLRLKAIDFDAISMDGLPEHIHVKPYQLNGITFIYDQFLAYGTVSFFDEAGLGKTLQVLIGVNLAITRTTDRGT